MESASQRPNGRDDVLSTFNGFIQTLAIARDDCDIPPARAAFVSAEALLTMIRVCFSPFFQGELLTHAYPGHDEQRSGMRQPWARLR